MINVQSTVLFDEALACLRAHRGSLGAAFKGRFVQIFLGMKFFQNSLPSMFAGSFVTSEVLQSLLDDLFAKAARPPNHSVLNIFRGNYLARTGLIAPGHATSQNTWRNNFNLQKGIGCYAPPADLSSQTFLDQDRRGCRYLTPATPGALAGANCSLCPSGAGYRNESHRKWLRIDPGGNGYAVLDLQNTANFLPYVAPGGARIPIVPLIVALYHDADPGLALGTRAAVSIAEFASDFNFSQNELTAYFESSMAAPLNARMASSPAWPVGASLYGIAATAAAPTTAIPAAPFVIQPAATTPPIPLLPVLGGTPTPPPAINSGYEAQQYVVAALAAAGWIAHDVSRQQLGYDVYAQRGVQKRYVEVKSSLGLCTPTLTAREWQQASYHQSDYVLAVIENFTPTGQNVVYWVRDPARSCIATQQVSVSHAIPRNSWTAATVALAQL